VLAGPITGGLVREGGKLVWSKYTVIGRSTLVVLNWSAETSTFVAMVAHCGTSTMKY
jgi:hypothetical protein